LLNIAATGPYGHAGAYQTLEEVVEHYADAEATVARYFSNGGWCQLEQFSTVTGCASLYPDAESNTEKSREMVLSENDNGRGMLDINLRPRDIAQIVAFLNTLTDPCILQRECVANWIPKPLDAPDGHQLNARGKDGKRL